MASSFPVGACVVLQNLVGAAQYNDKNGIVKSKLSSNGRQEVYVFGVNKSMAIKPTNMRYLPRELSSLSVPEMKGVLAASGSSTEDELSGMEKDILKGMVSEVTTSPEELAKLIAKANEPASDIPTPRSNKSTAQPSPPNINSSQLRQGAERMSSMTPDQLRQQAATMRAMGAATLRATNPAMAALTDEQINMSISQMEAMANNPQMMKMAMDQMKNMSESDLDAAVKQDLAAKRSSPSSSSNNNVATANATYSDVTSPTAVPAANTSVPDISPDQFKTASQQMASMSPDQLKQQATMLRGMSKETLRRTNPFMAKMSDAEIEMAIQQMESMASNPDMLKMAGEQLKNMSPEQFEQMKKMAGGAGGGGAGMMGSSAGNNATASAATDAPVGGFPTDPSQMMETLLSNPDQLNSMVKMMKQNPDMMKQMIAAQFGGGSEGQGGDTAKVEQMEKAIDQFAQMDDKQLERYLKVANTAQTVTKPVLNAFKATKNVLGVSAKTLIVLINIVFAVGAYTLYKWLKSRGAVEDSLIDPLVQEMPEVIGGDDEF
mmetsp:Transcript_2194/g.3997  ORF Transcript_2194/g.3997 Transcript_2194/m.3997 type:complete len:547 (-) Transcript_2194:74-1714(-)